MDGAATFRSCEMLHTSLKKPAFVCISTLDESVVEHRIKLLSTLNRIQLKSPGTLIFVAGPHIQGEIGKYFFGSVTAIPTTPKRGGVIRYLCSSLNENTRLDAMDSSREADILKKILKDV